MIQFNPKPGSEYNERTKHEVDSYHHLKRYIKGFDKQSSDGQEGDLYEGSFSKLGLYTLDFKRM